MLKIGNYNTLKVSRTVDFGVYLDGGDGIEILMPAKFVTRPLQPGDEVDAFVYTDSEDRLIATTEHPFAVVGEFAYLTVRQVNRVGAFLDWGLEAKELLVPFSEQPRTMSAGMQYLVYVYLDDNSQRVVASARIDRFLGNEYPTLRHGLKVDALVYRHEEIGYRVIVNNSFKGIIYANELFKPLTVGERIPAWVKHVRADGKIDLSAEPAMDARLDALAQRILSYMRSQPGAEMAVTDRSDPEEIKRLFSCSKKDFKRALGKLYKERLVALEPARVKLV